MDNLSKSNVLPNQPRSINSSNEELAAIRVGSSVGHCDAVWLYFDFEVLVVKLWAVDGHASGAVTVGYVTALGHKFRNYSVEFSACESQKQILYPSFSLAYFNKVQNSARNNVSIQLKNDIPCELTSNSYLQGDLICGL